MMHLTRQNNILKVAAATYGLAVAPDRPFVYLNDPQGRRLAELFVFSSVHARHGQDDTTQIGSPQPDLPQTGWVQAWEASETPDEILLSITVGSSLWKRKTFRFRCREHRLTYEVEVEGAGELCDVSYFGGYLSALTRWGSGFFWSGQHFRRGFNPEPNKDEAYYFAPEETSGVDLMGVPLPGRADWFFTPPPFCLAFEGKEGWVGLGLEAAPGQHRFTQYQYHGRREAFHLSVAFEGYTPVTGHYRLPAIGFDFGPGEYEVLGDHVRALQCQEGWPTVARRVKPAWWYEPIFCGWGAQSYVAAMQKGKAPAYSRQGLYEGFLQTLSDHQVSPGIVVLDDKWQATYGQNQVDEQKWPDLPGFIRAQHTQGRKVLLWLKAWDPEGLPVEECITNAAGLPLAVDPTNPQYEARLRESVGQMLSPAGYDADGFKIDFTARIPSGPGLCIAGDAWGLELMKVYLRILYEEAKQVKPDALVMAHTPHPYLADVLDMVRLNDINKDKDVNRAMIARAKLAAIACPDAIIDTDNWPIPDRAAWRKYLRLQPELGVPSLYYASHIDATLEPLEEKDYQLIREAWERHRYLRSGAGKKPASTRPPFSWPDWLHSWPFAARRRRSWL